MKLLLLDDDFVTIEQLKILIEFEKTWKLLDLSTVDYHEIDIVIVNPFEKKHALTLRDILEVNPKVRTIAITDRLNRNVSSTCEYCNSNYNRVCLLKPIQLKVLFDTINNFDKIQSCPLMDAFNNIEELIPLIVKQFKNLFYNEEELIISSNSCIESKEHTMEIMGLLTLFDQNNIDYTILENSSVKINI